MKKILILVLATSCVNAQNHANETAADTLYDSYKPNSQPTSYTPLLPLGGSSIIFDNGRFNTSIGTGLNGEDESVLQSTSLNMNSFGAGAQFITGTTNNRIADDFTVTHGGWQIDEIVVYAYQTGEVASTITSVNIQIWDGLPDDPGSTIVFGDNTTNRLTETGFSNILRVNEETTGTDDNRQITYNTVTVNMLLPEGTYWVDYQFEGSGGSGPWVPPITILGVDTTGNALQKIDADPWINYLDTGSLTVQGFPMLIMGSMPDLIFEDGFDTQQIPE